jgi:hypothetical protein
VAGDGNQKAEESPRLIPPFFCPPAALETECRALVTSLAIGEVVRPKGSIVVMATHTALRRFGCAVHRRNGRGHPVSRRARTRAMTIVAIQLLANAVFGVAEVDLVRPRKNREPLKAAALVASIARGQIASFSLSSRAVTLVARRVRAFTCRYRERHTTT